MQFRLSPPDYSGRGLVNLVAEIEARLGSDPPCDRLDAPLPEGDSWVLAVFDGLGSCQLDHPAAEPLRAARTTDLDAPFPSTTTVSLATMATGLPPSGHGLIGYQLYLPDADLVANTIKWTTLWGEPFGFDHEGFLPETMWERLARAGIESVVVQPANFAGSPLSRTLYRGARFEGVHTTGEWVEAVTGLARPRRLVVAYLPHVDIAAHMTGQNSTEYRDALSMVAGVWEQLRILLAPEIVLVGTSDHGHVDIPAERQVKLPKVDHRDRILYGDSRAMFIKGSAPTGEVPGTYVATADLDRYWGSGTHRHPDRLPDGVLFADPGYAILHRFSDTRMIGHHGGLTDEERLIPLLLR